MNSLRKQTTWITGPVNSGFWISTRKVRKALLGFFVFMWVGVLSAQSPTIINTTPTNPSCNGYYNGNIVVRVTTTIGNKLYYHIDSVGAGITATTDYDSFVIVNATDDYNIPNLGANPNGYVIHFTEDSINYSNTVLITLTEPNAVVVTPTVTNDICAGSVSFSSVGGWSTIFTYDLNASGTFTTTATYSDLADGSYTVDVKDVNGCVGAQQSFTIVPTDNTAPVLGIKAAVTVYLDSLGKRVVDSADVDINTTDDCNFTLTVTSNALTCADTNNTTTLTVTATDELGNQSTGSVVVTVKDNRAPTVLPHKYNIVYLDATGKVTIDPNEVDSASFDACGIVQKKVSQDVYTCATAGDTLQKTFELRDVSGNISNAQIYVVVLDTFRPNFTLAASYDLILDEDGVDTLDAATFASNLSDNCGVDSLHVFGDSVFDCSMVGTAQTMQIRLTDKSGNDTIKSITINVIDNASPNTLMVRDFDLYLDASGVATLFADSVVLNAEDNCSIKDTTLSQTSFDCSHIGTNSVTITITDPSNNSTQKSINITVHDTLAPNNIVVNDITRYLDSNGADTISVFDVYVSGADNCGITAVDISDSTFDCSQVDTFDLVVSIKDASGNVTLDTAKIIVLDTFRPNFTLASSYDLVLDEDGADTLDAATFASNLSDNCGVDSLHVFGDSIFDCSMAGTAQTMQIRLTDKNGNDTIKSITINVKDTTAPDSLGVRDFDLYLDASGAATLYADSVVLYTSDNCSIKDTTLSQTSFDCSHIGANSVTVTIKDPSNNSTQKSIDITVHDTLAPNNLVVKDITRYLDSIGADTISVFDVYVSSADNCGIAKIDVSDSTFDCSNIGTFKVVVTVTDASGNSSTDTASITLLDTLAPFKVILNKTVDVYLDDLGAATLEKDSVVDQVFENCGIQDTILSKTAFSCVDIGSLQKVYVTINDVNGNAYYDSILVSVNDTVKPVAIAKYKDTVYLDANGQGSLTANDIDSGSYDNCAVQPPTTIDITSFTCVNANKVIDVTLTVTDVNGNTNTAVTPVLVLDTVKPVLVLSNVTAFIDGDGDDTLKVIDIDNGVYDNCALKRRWLSDSVVSCGSLGNNTITFYAEDVNGNIASKTFTVDVRDTVAPTITVKNATIYIDTASGAKLEQSMVVVLVNDNCGIDTVVLSKDSFDLTNVGPNNVTVTVTDKSGNSTNKVVVVTVEIGDSDNDGIPDYVERGGDLDFDNIKDYLDLDSDQDGIADATEAGANPVLPIDYDADGHPDYLDLDSDNDGINDAWEAKAGDVDGNGLKDDPTTLILNAPDSDGDGLPDYLDLDSDDDGLTDLLESLGGLIDADQDGVVDGVDSDGDGIIDDADGAPGFGDMNGLDPVDTDGDGDEDFRDTDSDGDTIPDSVELDADVDADGLPNYRDLDSDGDSLPDKVEAGADPTNPVDTDSDGDANYLDTDSDDDTIPDTVEAGADPTNPVDTDADGSADYIDTDADNDTIPDEVEAGADPNNPDDTDGDGDMDFRDLDSDNDGINDKTEAGSDPTNPLDTDSDGIMDFRDIDSDGDGINDKIEGTIDTDGDGVPNYLDTDSDNDELLDEDEGTVDANGNGIPDYIDAQVVIPEGFSPNGDGDNEVFYIKGLKVYTQAEIIVFNRNGQIVFESGPGYKNNWGGTSTNSTPGWGSDLPEGLYYYVFKYNGQGREPITGNVYIKR